MVALTDGGLVQRLKDKARRVHIQSLAFAVAVTALVLLIPFG